MHILGLNIGHNATACLLTDGKIVECVSEERFSRIKNHSGIPFRSIEYLMKHNGLTLSEVDHIVFDQHYEIESDPYMGKRIMENYTNKSFKNKIISKLGYRRPELYHNLLSIKRSLKPIEKREHRLRRLSHGISRALQFPIDKIMVIDHHLAHAMATCFNLPQDKKTLIFTLDGEGNGTCATVSIYDGREIKVISRTNKRASLGYLYGNATLALGMKPLEHEFKVMGLAPYAKEHNIAKVYPRFKELIRLGEGLEFTSEFEMIFSDNFFLDEMKFVRFDIVAGAVQKLAEELVTAWVQKAVKQTGIDSIALSGGVFMNVKANQKIAELSEVKSLFVMPSAGDESNAIGSCMYGYKMYCNQHNLPFSPEPMQDLYLGPEYDEKYVNNFIRKEEVTKKYKVSTPKNINKEIARLLSKGEIVARCSGKSEWGARALGNRSIIANPSHPETIRFLNEAIKDRDFWMPFTPSMLDSEMSKYIVNPKKIAAPYMVLTFDSTELAQKHLPAAMHPYDRTIRPQMVYEKWNPDYYAILKEFKKLTGIGAVLNTSFNLHGEPNVLTPEDALHTVENSGLKYLVLDKYLLEKII